MDEFSQMKAMNRSSVLRLIRAPLLGLQGAFRLLSLAYLVCFPVSQAFDINGNKWPGAATDFYVSIDGQSQTGVDWNDAFIAAMEDWNRETDFNFTLIPQYRDPCANDNLNGVDFGSTVCGTEFGDNTLAVALRQFARPVLGPPPIVESDIVFNSTVAFDIYDGNLNQFGQSFNGIDFRRVALHELGHALGLDHEPSNPAIMASTISNRDRLAADDILGANTLYGGLRNCTTQALKFGSTFNSLSQGDCTVDELTVGEGDPSFIDLYSFSFDAPGTITASMSSSSLDSVLILADSGLDFLVADEGAFTNCDSNISRSVPAGDYLLLANTFNEEVNAGCTITGPYQLDVSFTTGSEIKLGGTRSLGGGVANAGFSGGVSADNGSTFGNRFTADQSLDISASISVDPAHQGEAGFLVVVGNLDGTSYFLNEQGLFIRADEVPGQILPAANKNLSAVESIAIVRDLVPADIGITSSTLNFVVGYGLQSDPEEIYYHEHPINLQILPQ